MRRWIIMLCAFWLLTPTAPAAAQNADPTAAAVADDPRLADEQAIRAQVSRWLALIKAKDAAGIAALYTADGALMPPDAPVARGAAAIEQGWAGMMAMEGFALTFEPDEILVAGSGDLAMDRGTYRLAMTPGGKAASDTGKYVVVWRKVGGAWKAAADIFNSDGPATK